MKYSFEQIKKYLQELLEKYCEPELSLWIGEKEYVIILYSDFCSIQRCGEQVEIMEFETIDKLYESVIFDGIVLKNDWYRIDKIESDDFAYLGLPTVL